MMASAHQWSSPLRVKQKKGLACLLELAGHFVNDNNYHLNLQQLATITVITPLKWLHSYNVFRA